MKSKEFFENTILKLNDELFEIIKKQLIGSNKPITFSFFSLDEITREILAEKLNDYFENLEKEEKSFDEILKKYFEDWESIVDNKVAKEPRATRKNSNPTIPRSRQYYKFATEKTKDITMENITDFTRIMMCLDIKSLNNNSNCIEDFDLTIENLDVTRILQSIKEEQKNLRNPVVGRKDLFFKNLWSQVIMIVMFYHIKNNEIVGEY